MNDKIKQLEKQLAEAKAAHNYILNKSDQCLQTPDQIKVRFYDAVMPLLKSALEQRTRHGWNRREVEEAVFKRVLGAAFGEEVLGHLDKI